jgi:DNA-binding NtrC family response regulator
VVLVVERALERRATARELERHRRQAEDAYRIDRLVGTSEAIAELREIVGRVAASEARGVLVRGEAGTGKGLVAHLLHFGSRRREAPFVRLSVRGRDEEVLEREIFGYEKSALPEASVATRGLIERASGGTVYIEEVADLPLICQARLLDVLEDGAVRRVGGVRALNVDVRVVAATHHDLPARVRAGSFREDLYYRLSAVPIDLPPLRERLEDLPELSGSLMDELAPEIGRTFEPLSEAALARLRRHTWPGNVRELRNVLERAMIHAVGSAIDPEDLVLHPTEASVVDTETLTLEEMEKEMIRRALAACGGNQAQAARRLGISRDTLRYRIKKYGL